MKPYIWEKPKRSKSVVQLDVDGERQLWITTFAAAVIELRDWIAGDVQPGDVEWRRRLECERLADLAVSEYRLLVADSFPREVR